MNKDDSIAGNEEQVQEVTTQIVPSYPVRGVLALETPPSVALKQAKEAADALKGVIASKDKVVKFNGEIYPEFEDWQLCGKFYGVTTRVVWTRYVEFGSVRGFEARADAVLIANSQVISSAESMCLSDEENWGFRPIYEWKTVDGVKERVQVGETPVPLFQLRSMSQTRAEAKAYRNVLSWVMVLAGYKPTPAEEMTGTEKGSSKSSDPVCPKCGKSGTIIKGKKEYGSGWVCWTKNGGCNAKFKDGDKSIEDQLGGGGSAKAEDEAQNQQLRRETAKEMGIEVKEDDPDLVPKLQQSIVEAKLKKLKEDAEKQKADNAAKEAKKGDKPKLVTKPPEPAPVEEAKAPEISERDRKLDTIIIPKCGLKRTYVALFICTVLGKEPKNPSGLNAIKEAGEILRSTPPREIDQVIDATVRFVTQHSVEQNQALILKEDAELWVEFSKMFAETQAPA